MDRRKEIGLDVEASKMELNDAIERYQDSLDELMMARTRFRNMEKEMENKKKKLDDARIVLSKYNRENRNVNS